MRSTERELALGCGAPVAPALVALSLIGLGGVALAAAPVPVSPGTPQEVSLAAGACPTFSWTFDPGGGATELVVYRLDPDDAGTRPESAPPVLKERLPPGTVSWTPPVDRCLDAGGRYVWFVRADRSGGGGDRGAGAQWSEGSFFEVSTVLPPGGGDREPPGDADPSSAAAARAATAPLLETELLAPLMFADSATWVSVEDPPPWSVAGTAGGPEPHARVAGQANVPSIQTSNSIFSGGEFAYNEPRTVTYIVPASAFAVRSNHEADGWELHPDGYGFVPSVSGTLGDVPLSAPLLDLPQSAEVVSFRCLFFDNVELLEKPGEPDVDDLHLQMQLVRQRPDDVTGTSMALVSASSDGSKSQIQRAQTFTITDSVLQSHFVSYRIEGTYIAESQGSSLRFYGCVLELDVQVVDPR